jgi:hypothetical protein
VVGQLLAALQVRRIREFLKMAVASVDLEPKGFSWHLYQNRLYPFFVVALTLQPEFSEHS